MEVVTSPKTTATALSTQSSMESCLDSPTATVASNVKTQCSGKCPKSKKSKSKMPYFWSGDDVIKWLRKHCGQYHEIYASNFRENDITGRSLVRLTDNKLERMGIDNPDHREDLMKQILRLKLRTEAQELKSLDQKGTCTLALEKNVFRKIEINKCTLNQSEEETLDEPKDT